MALATSDSGTVFVTAGGGATADLTTYTISATTSLLIAFVHLSGTVGTVVMTWDFGATNQVMTQVAAISNTTLNVLAFILTNPTSGQRTLHASSSTAGLNLLGAISYSGSDIATGIDLTSIVTNTGTGTAQTSGPITSPTTGVTVAAIFASNNIGSSTLTTVYRSGGRSLTRATTGGVNTHTFTTVSSVTWCTVGFAVLAGSGRSPGAGGTGRQFFGELQQMGIEGPSIILNGSMGVF